MTSTNLIETPATTEGETTTDLVPVEAPEAPATREVKPVVLKRLNKLTKDAQTFFEKAAKKDDEAVAFYWKGVEVIRQVRDENLVSESGADYKSFADYVAENFKVSRDQGDKFARAAKVVERIVAELGDDIVKYPLPTAEGTIRPLGVVLDADPKGTKKLASRAWVKAYEQAEQKVADKPLKQAVPSAKDVSAARNTFPALKPKVKAPKAPAPKPTLGEDADPLAHTLLALASQFVPNGVHFDQFIDLLGEGLKLAAEGVEFKAIKAQADAVRACI